MVLVACGAALASALTGVATADAAPSHQIYINKGFYVNKKVGLIHRGMTPAQVRRKLGKPSWKGGDGSPHELEYTFRRQGFSILFRYNHLVYLTDGESFPSPLWHTTKGIGIGSSVTALVQAYGTRVTKPPHEGQYANIGWVAFWILAPHHHGGAPATYFMVNAKGEVVSMDLTFDKALY